MNTFSLFLAVFLFLSFVALSSPAPKIFDVSKRPVPPFFKKSLRNSRSRDFNSLKPPENRTDNIHQGESLKKYSIRRPLVTTTKTPKPSSEEESFPNFHKRNITSLYKPKKIYSSFIGLRRIPLPKSTIGEEIFDRTTTTTTTTTATRSTSSSATLPKPTSTHRFTAPSFWKFRRISAGASSKFANRTRIFGKTKGTTTTSSTTTRTTTKSTSTTVTTRTTTTESATTVTSKSTTVTTRTTTTESATTVTSTTTLSTSTTVGTIDTTSASNRIEIVSTTISPEVTTVKITRKSSKMGHFGSGEKEQRPKKGEREIVVGGKVIKIPAESFLTVHTMIGRFKIPRGFETLFDIDRSGNVILLSKRGLPLEKIYLPPL